MYNVMFFILFLSIVISPWWFGSVGNVVVRTNEVNQHHARLVLGWVTVCRRLNHLCI